MPYATTKDNVANDLREELHKLLLDLGWNLDVHPTGDYFLWAEGGRSA
jgi:hypothetical protein